jgi:L-aspartate oxidase
MTQRNMPTQDTQVLIIGSGLAGLSLALRTADQRRVTLVTKKALNAGATQWAQGGIAAVLGSDDALAHHVADTLTAGAGLCQRATVEFVVEHGRQAIDWLVSHGVIFDRDLQEAAGLHLTREGGHSHRRIVHAQDATGRAVQSTLEAQVLAHPNITVREWHVAVDLITRRKLGLGGPDRVLGAYVLDAKSGQVHTMAAEHVVLATGGAGKVYLYTTNPDTATGDGIAIGWRAGVSVANMEFIQFHPTCLFHPDNRSFLITEAVRGEGGLLRLPNGERFMPAYDERAELAPRDIVARSIDFEMKKRGLDCVYLDISHKGSDFIRSHFPNIFETCLRYGIDITKAPIPVVPAAHYTCGGLVADLAGRTSLPGLYAVGETAHTGLHGANRLASNSLLECVVFSQAAASDILASGPLQTVVLPTWDESRVTDADEAVVIAHNWDELRRFMWNYVGIVRTHKRLLRAASRIELLEHEIRDYYANFKISADLLELRNLVTVADLIVRCALARKESRGLHFSRDFPALLPTASDSIITP